MTNEKIGNIKSVYMMSSELGFKSEKTNNEQDQLSFLMTGGI